MEEDSAAAGSSLAIPAEAEPRIPWPRLAAGLDLVPSRNPILLLRHTASSLPKLPTHRSGRQIDLGRVLMTALDVD